MTMDSEIEQQVLRRLELDSAISSREICIESHCGVVTLSGTVPSYRESSTIYSATSRAPGVRGVVNKIEVKNGRHFIPAQSALPDQLIPLPVSPRPAPGDRQLNASH